MIAPGQLATARAAQNQTLDASCVVGTLTYGVVDEATGVLTQTLDEVWRGSCSVKTSRGRVVEDGGKLTFDAGVTFTVPVEGTELLEPGMVAKVLDARYDQALVGMRFRLVEPEAGTLLTLRRFNAEVMP